jgi:hypothetical protein
MRITSTIAAAALAAGLAFGATAANATTTFTQIDSTNLNASGTDYFGADIDSQPGSFKHTFSFSLDSTSFANAVATTLKLRGFDIDFTSIDLDGAAFGQDLFDPAPEIWSLPETLFNSGLHTITVYGKVLGTGNGSYSGTLNVAAVPEASTWAMMILGLGFAGAAMRRRQQQTVRYNFA